MKARDILRKINSTGKCTEVRQRGSHIRIRCESTGTVVYTTIPMHGTKDLGAGLVRSIERDFEPCLGKQWLRT